MTSFPFSSKLIPNILLLSASITYSRLCANTQAPMRFKHLRPQLERITSLPEKKKKKKIFTYTKKKKKEKNPSSLRFRKQLTVTNRIWLEQKYLGPPRRCLIESNYPGRYADRGRSLSWLPFLSRNWHDIHIYAIYRGQYTYPWTDEQRAHSRLCTSSSLPFSSWIRSRARGRQ